MKRDNAPVSGTGKPFAHKDAGTAEKTSTQKGGLSAAYRRRMRKMTVCFILAAAGLLALAAGIVLAWVGVSLFGVAVVSCLVVLIAEFFLV